MPGINDLSDDQFLQLIQPEDSVAQQREAALAAQNADHLSQLDSVPDPQAAAANVMRGGDSEAAQSAYALSRKLKLPPALIRSNPKFYESLQRATETGSLWADSPATAAFFQNSERSELAYHDAPTMAQSEKWARTPPAAVVHGLGSAVYGIGQATAAADRIAAATDAKIDEFGGQLLGKKRYAELMKTLDTYLPSDQDIAEAVPFLTDQYLAPKLISGGAATRDFASTVAGFDLTDPEQKDLFIDTTMFFGDIVPALVVGIFAPEAVPAIIGAQGVGAQAQRLDAEGKLGQSVRSDVGLLVAGAVSGYLGKFGITRYLEELPAGIRNNVLRRTTDLLATGTYEVGVDISQTVASEAVFATANDEEFNPFPNGITQQELPVFLASLVIRGGVQAVNRNVGAFHDEKLIREGAAESRSVNDLNDLNRQVKFRQKAPEEYSKFLKQAGFDNRDIFIDRAAVEAYVDSADDGPAMGLLTDKLDAQMGDKVRVSATEFMTEISDTKAYDILKDSITQTPMSTSPAMAPEEMVRIREAFGEEAKRAEAKMAEDRELDNVAKEISDALVATERVKPHLAKKMGAIAVMYANSMARRRGQPLSEVLANLTIRGPSETADGGLAQQAFHGTGATGIEDQGFKLVKIGSGEGNQGFGWGIYFAGQRGVADGYRRRLAGIAKTPKERDAEQGALYRAEIPESSELLNWDKSLSEQPETVRKAIERIRQDTPAEMQWMLDNVTPDTPGDKLYGVIGELAAEMNPDGVDNAQRAGSELLRKYGVPGLRYLDGTSRNRPLKSVKRDFLAELPEDADFDEVMGALGTGQFSPANEAVIKALAADDWLGFDYPAQALSAALGPDLTNYDPSPALRKAISDAQEGGTNNYVIWDEKHLNNDVQRLLQSPVDPSKFFDFGDATSPPKLANTLSSAFKRWFRGSKVTNPDGTPRIVYHGTAGEFTVFSDGTQASGHATSALGYFVTEDRAQAQHYAENASGGVPAEERVLSLYAAIKRPYTMSLSEAQSFTDADAAAARKRELQEQGYDGIRIEGTDTWVAFDSNQLKSTENGGAFSESDDIFEQRVGEVRGWYSPSQVLIRLTRASDETTFLHEFAHYMRHQMDVMGDTKFSGAVNAWHASEAKDVAKEARKYAADATRAAKKSGLNVGKVSISEADAQRYFTEGTTGIRVKDTYLYKAGQEQFARGFEAYLREGVAPSLELRDVFRSLAEVFRRIYQAFGGNLRVNLGPEVRKVYDKLLATEDQISAMSEASSKYKGLFTDAAMAGMTEKQWDAYQGLKAKQEGMAEESVREQWMRKIRRMLTKDWARERSDLIEETLEGIRGEKRHHARSVLTGDEESSFKLDLAAVKQMVGEDAVSKLGTEFKRVPPRLRKMVRGGGEGLHPDQAAEMLGYSSGEALLDDLLHAPTAIQEATERADNIMAERHKDEVSDESLAAMADEAMANEGYAEVLMAEIRALGRESTAGRAAVLKDFAQDQINKLKYNEIKPDLYRRGQARAAREAEAALREGDKEGARRAKEQQQIQYYLERAARKGRESIEKRIKDLKRFDKASVRKAISMAGGGHMERIDAILSHFELRKSVSLKKFKESLGEWAARRREENGDEFVLSDEVLDEGTRTHWREMTVEQLEDVFNAVKSIEHTARFANKVRLAEETQEYESAVQQLVRQITELPEKYKPSRAGDNTADRGGPVRNLAADVARALRIPGAVAQLTKIPFMVKYLDHGELAGFAQDVLVQPFTDAHFAENTLHNQTSRLVSDAIRSRGEEFHVRMAKKYDIEGLDSPVLGWGALMYALTSGNESGLRTMLLGEKWAKDEGSVTDLNPTFQRVVGILTKEDWDLVKMIWQQMDILYPRMAEVRRAQTGIAPPKIQPRAVRTKFGVVEGGYFPLKKDYERAVFLNEQEKSTKANEHAEEVNSLFFSPFRPTAVTASATKERTGAVYPIDLNPARITTHFSEVIHYITHHDAVRQAVRVTSDPRFQNAVTRALGPENYAQFRPWIESVAKQGREMGPVTFIGKVLHHFQTGATLTYLGYRASTVMMQFAGINTSAAEVGGKYMLKGMHMTVKGWKANQEALDWAIAHSKIMGSRVTEMDREMYRAYKEIDSGVITVGGKTLHLSAKKYLRRYELASMKLIGHVQLRSVDLPTWYAGYFKEMDSSGDEARAFRAADRAVENSQGSGRIAESAAIMRDKNWRIFTMFMTWFSSVTNQQIGIARDLSSGRADPIELASRAGWVFLAGPILDMAFHGQLWPNDEDDEDTLAGEFFRSAIGYNIAGVPLVRDAVSYLAEGYEYQLSPVESLVSNGLRGVKNVATAPFTGRAPTMGDYKGLSEGIATALHIPGGAQAWDTGEALYRWLKEGEDIGMKDLIFGPEKKK